MTNSGHSFFTNRGYSIGIDSMDERKSLSARYLCWRDWVSKTQQ